MEMLEYKGYLGSVEVSVEDGVLHGKLLFVNDLVTYQATDVPGLQREFEAAVDDYLETCAAVGKPPEQTFSGVFNVRIGPELHRKAAIKAAREGLKLNALVAAAVEQYVSDRPVVHTHNHQVHVKVTHGPSVAATAVAAQGFTHIPVGGVADALH
jgi:predicted HicB family RNase H-like nuclease